MDMRKKNDVGNITDDGKGVLWLRAVTTRAGICQQPLHFGKCEAKWSWVVADDQQELAHLLLTALHAGVGVPTVRKWKLRQSSLGATGNL